MKRILTLFALVICVIVLASISNSGNSNYIIRSLIEEGNRDWDSSKIDSVIAMSSELADVLTADEHPMILPDKDLVYYDPELEYGLIIHIRDTIRTTRFQLGSNRKK